MPVSIADAYPAALPVGQLPRGSAIPAATPVGAIAGDVLLGVATAAAVSRVVRAAVDPKRTGAVIEPHAGGPRLAPPSLDMQRLLLLHHAAAVAGSPGGVRAKGAPVGRRGGLLAQAQALQLAAHFHGDDQRDRVLLGAGQRLQPAEGLRLQRQSCGNGLTQVAE